VDGGDSPEAARRVGFEVGDKEVEGEAVVASVHDGDELH
jgi:hypothetical protein